MDQIVMPTQSPLVPYYESPFWGFLVSACLFGIILAQGYAYATCNNDSWKLRTTVAAVIISDFVALCMQAEWLHHYLLTFYGIPTELEILIPIGPISLAFSYTTVLIVEMFFATRVYLLTKRIWVTIIIVLAATLGYASSIVTVINGLQAGTVASLGDVVLKTAVSIYCGLSIVSAGTVSVTLSHQLHEAWSKIQIRGTSLALQSLFRFILTRGITVCALQVTKLIVFVVYSDRLYWIGFVIIASRLYIITMLAILNHRREMRNKLGETVTDSDHIQFKSHERSYQDLESPSNSFIISQGYGPSPIATPLPIGIKISRTVTEKSI